MATLRRPLIAPARTAIAPKEKASKAAAHVAPARFAVETSMPTISTPTRSEVQRTRPSRATSVTRAAAFSKMSRRRETGFASRRSIVPASSSPAVARAPAPIAAMASSNGTMNAKSSLPRYPAPDV